MAILRTLFILIISYTLALSPIALARSGPLDLIPTIKAEDSDDDDEGGDDDDDEGDDDDDDDEGDGEEEEEGEEEEDPDAALNEAQGDQWLALANSLVVGFLASSIAKNCPKKKTIDSKMVLLAGVIYLGAEIFATKRDKELREKIEGEYIEGVGDSEEGDESGDEAEEGEENGGEANENESEEGEEEEEKEEDPQIKSLEAQKEAYDELEKTAKIKKSFQFAAAGVFAAASGVAAIQWMREEIAFRACQKAITAADSALPGVCTATATVPDGCEAAAVTCKTTLTALKAKLMAYNKQRNQPNSISTVKEAEMQAIFTESQTEFETCGAHPTVSVPIKSASTACLSYFAKIESNMMVCQPQEEEGKGGDEGSDGGGGGGETTSTTHDFELELIRRFADYIDIKIEATPAFQKNIKPQERNLFKEAVKRLFLGGADFLFPPSTGFCRWSGGFYGQHGICGSGSWRCPQHNEVDEREV